MTGMGKLIELRFDCFHHLGVAMARVHHSNASGKINIAIAFDIPDLSIFGAFSIDFGHHPNTARNGGGLAFLYICVFHGAVPVL